MFANFAALRRTALALLALAGVLPLSIDYAGAGPRPFNGNPIVVPGTFQAEDFDKGGQGVGYSDKVKGNAGALYRAGGSVDIIESPSGQSYVINNFQTGEWLAYTINVTKTDQYDIDLRVSSTFTGSAF